MTATTRAALAGAIFAAFVAAPNAVAQSRFFSLPFLPDASWQTFVRHTVASDPATIRLTLRNYSGAIGTYTRQVPANRAIQFNSRHMRQDGMPPGPWYGFIAFTGANLPQIFLRSDTGFVVNLNAVAEPLSAAVIRVLHQEFPAISAYRFGESVLTLNPGRNTRQVGILRVVNFTQQAMDVIFLLRDDAGQTGSARDSIPAFQASTYRSADLERMAGITASTGKWVVYILTTELPGVQAGIWSVPAGLYAPTDSHPPLILDGQLSQSADRSGPVAEQAASTPEELFARYSKVWMDRLHPDHATAQAAPDANTRATAYKITILSTRYLGSHHSMPPGYASSSC